MISARPQAASRTPRMLLDHTRPAFDIDADDQRAALKSSERDRRARVAGSHFAERSTSARTADPRRGVLGASRDAIASRTGTRAAFVDLLHGPRTLQRPSGTPSGFAWTCTTSATKQTLDREPTDRAAAPAAMRQELASIGAGHERSARGSSTGRVGHRAPDGALEQPAGSSVDAACAWSRRLRRAGEGSSAWKLPAVATPMEDPSCRAARGGTCRVQAFPINSLGIMRLPRTRYRS